MEQILDEILNAPHISDEITIIKLFYDGCTICVEKVNKCDGEYKITKRHEINYPLILEMQDQCSEYIAPLHISNGPDSQARK